MSLVAEYTDSEEEEKGDKSNPKEEEDEDDKDKCSSTGPSGGLINPFGLDNNSSSSSSDEDTAQKSTSSAPIQLDNPFRSFGAGNVAAEDSALRVEFREEDAQKTAILERHVKLSQVIELNTRINGKRICWRHRKGKCSFGHNCKYAHDTDTEVLAQNNGALILPPSITPLETNIQPVNISPSKIPHKNPFSMDNVDWDAEAPVTLSSLAKLVGGGNKSTNRNGEEEDEEQGHGRRKRKKTGLGNDLIPGKRVMASYHKKKLNDKIKGQ